MKRELRSGPIGISGTEASNTMRLSGSPTKSVRFADEDPMNNDNIFRKKVCELQNLKKDGVKKIGKFLSSISLSLKKSIISKVAVAFFGESSYEIEIAKHEKIYRNSNI